MAYEPGEEGLTGFEPRTASVTTRLAVSGTVRYLAAWRLDVSIVASPESAWERVCRITAPRRPHLYVPAFTLVRPVVQRLGVRLTEFQPTLELSAGLSGVAAQRPTLVEVGGKAPEHTGLEAESSGPVAPDFGTFSPILVGREDAHVLAHFVYLAVESYEARELRSVDYELQVAGEELLFIPGVWDPRYIHESNWRLLLREFDGLVA
jgi:hypothetical protein